VKRTDNILVLCPYPKGEAAGQRLKYEQYFPSWEKEGFNVEVSEYMDKDLWEIVYEKGYFYRKLLGIVKGHLRRFRDLFLIRKFNIVYIFQWTTPFGIGLYDFLIRALSKKIIFDVEDFVVLQNTIEENPNPILRFIRSKKKTMYLIKNSDYVISSSPSLNTFCKNFNKNNLSSFISSSVDTDRFIPSNNYKNDHKVTIGWTGTFGSKSYLDKLRDVFFELDKVCDFKLKFITNFDYKISGLDIEVIKWNKKNEVRDLQSLDIGVYPLEDSQWVKGKSGLKAIQYMAFGIPTVASDLGINSEIISHGKNGLLVKNDKDWFEALKKLVEEPELRKTLGLAARKKAVEKYSLSAIESEYLDILKSTK